MPRLGAHLSIAGGLPRAVDRAEASGCEALQIFTKSAGQWRARELPPEEIALFRRRVRQTKIRPVVAHNSYLINLAAADRRAAAAVDRRARRGTGSRRIARPRRPGHAPGLATPRAREAGGLKLIADGLASILASRPDGHTRILLEHTAGQGTNLGHRFEHLADDHRPARRIAARRRLPRHLPSARRRLRHLLARRATTRRSAQFGAIVGFSRLKAFHLNDSKKPCASRVDRHEHIGKGCLGLAPFRRLVNDPRFAGLPMLLETPKLDTPRSRRLSDVDPFDKMNLDVLRRLVAESLIADR